jgi:hypothetical protein
VFRTRPSGEVVTALGNELKREVGAEAVDLRKAHDRHSRPPCAWWPRRRSRPRLDGPPTSCGGPGPSICSDPSPILQLGAEGLGCAVDQFPKRDRLTASPLSRAQQPVDHVFMRGNLPPKSGRPLPSIQRIDLSRFYAHRRTLSEMVFKKC